MTFILMCFVSELFTQFFSSAILLTSESSGVNELSSVMCLVHLGVWVSC